jgi:hypothetical protein
MIVVDHVLSCFGGSAGHGPKLRNATRRPLCAAASSRSAGPAAPETPRSMRRARRSPPEGSMKAAPAETVRDQGPRR